MSPTDLATRRFREVPVASIQGTLALDLQPRHELPDPGPATRRRRSSMADVVSIDRGLRLRLEEWSRRYAQAVVEIIGGDRPASQLVRWTAPHVYDDLTRRAVLVARAGGHVPGAARVQPVRPKVVSAHSCVVAGNAVETSVHIRYGDRSRAVAARFELHAENWICTALEFA